MEEQINRYRTKLQNNIRRKETSYRRVLDRMKSAFSREGGPSFEYSGDEFEWRTLRAEISVLKDELADFDAIFNIKETPDHE